MMLKTVSLAAMVLVGFMMFPPNTTTTSRWRFSWDG